MNDNSFPEAWEILRMWLPSDLEQTAWRSGFFQRARGLQDAEQWLRIILMHVAGGLSLEQTVVRAHELGLPKVSAVALFKRLRGAHDWLLELTRHLQREQQRLWGKYRVPAPPQRLRVIDATDIQEPGSTGTALRLHYSLQLPELCCDHFELTDQRGGEKLGRFHFAPGEWILADRGYSHRAGAALVLKAGAQLILRWNPSVFPLESDEGKSFEPMSAVEGMELGEVRQWPVWFTWEKKRYRLWVCAIRKSQEAAARARQKVLNKARSNGTKIVQPQSLALSEYTFVLTSLSPEQLAPTAVLELYRCRWQVELAFKRLKSLLEAGHVPKHDDGSAKSWMQAKILSALLIERVLCEGNFFFPSGYPVHGGKPLAQLS
jgi:hypothetical protein